ncbi:MAG: hypothetical protein WBP81_02930 [Solirubrobacteraceae bacterium]
MSLLTTSDELDQRGHCRFHLAPYLQPGLLPVVALRARSLALLA